MLAILLAAAQSVAAAAVSPTPSAIVAAAKPVEWVAIAPEDLLVMDLAPDATGRARRVVIQLIAAPFSQGWVANVRTLARAHWWDGTAVTRVQDNYVAQWGDPDGEDKVKAKPLPAGLRKMGEGEYTMSSSTFEQSLVSRVAPTMADTENEEQRHKLLEILHKGDAYAQTIDIAHGWPVAGDARHVWPVHCYATVGVGRDLSPDTGTGAELYAVIGHAPRHLDRNIAVVGRVVEGIENLSSLPRGTGPLGVYATPGERTAIRSVRLASELPAGERPRLQFLSTESDSFAAYANARANRHDAFFIHPAGGADVCNVPVPIRREP